MKKDKTVLRSLLSVLLVVTLCLTAITGATFALMKDILSSENNVIKSGILEIDIEVRQSNGEYLSVRKNDIPVLNYDRWEAGYTQVLNARVVNSGTLSLAYEMEVLAEGIVEAMLNNEPLLSDVIEVYYASDEVLMATRQDFEDAVTSGELKHLGNLTQLLLARTVLKDVLNPSKTGEPDAESADYVTFVFKMHDTVLTEYQGLTVGDETFEFNLYAKQNTHETDSFDNLYDIGKTTTIIFNDGKTHDLNDMSVILSPISDVTDCIVAEGAGTVVNIYGGHYDVSSKDCAVWAKNGAVVNIYGGTFFCDGLGKPAVPTDHQDLIYAGDGGTINIYGGYFASRDEGAWLLNEKDGKGTITVHGGTFKDWNPGDNDSEGPHTSFLETGTSILASVKGDATFYSINEADNAMNIDKEGDMSLVGDLTIIDVPLFHNADVTEPTVIEGNGYTVDLVLYPDNELIDTGGYYPNLSTIFSSTNSSKITVNDLTFTGTGYFISAGDYRPEARTTAITEFNNVNIIEMELLQFSKWCTALNTCGTAILNNCNIYGSSRSPMDPDYGSADASFPYDLVVSNSSKTYIDGGHIGNIYLDNSANCEITNAEIDSVYTEAWNNSKLIIGGGSHVKKIVMNLYLARLSVEGDAIIDELDLTKISKTYVGRISIADTATVGKIIDGDKTFTDLQSWKDWKATT